MKIGYTNRGYAQTRNIAYAAAHDVRHVRDLFSILRKLRRHYSMALQSFALPVGGGVQVVHTFNSVVLGGRSWAVTYETTLPRSNRLPKFLIKLAWGRLSKPQCLGILALSECARQRLITDLDTNIAKMDACTRAAIRAKIRVLHPPQDILITADKKEFAGPLRLALVGHDFYRKGGLEVLLALDRLATEGADIHLSIAGKMTAGDYASRAGTAEEAHARELIHKNQDRVNVMGPLPWGAVMNLLQRSHLLCLPTWGDTYGYSVLEGQAAGCPAITINLRALPEINNEECGWVIPVPKLPNGDGDHDTKEKRNQFRALLVEGLIRALRQAYTERPLLRQKSIRSLERIQREHNPARHAEILQSMYRLAIIGMNSSRPA